MVREESDSAEGRRAGLRRSAAHVARRPAQAQWAGIVRYVRQRLGVGPRSGPGLLDGCCAGGYRGSRARRERRGGPNETWRLVSVRGGRHALRAPRRCESSDVLPIAAPSGSASPRPSSMRMKDSANRAKTPGFIGISVRTRPVRPRFYPRRRGAPFATVSGRPCESGEQEPEHGGPR